MSNLHKFKAYFGMVPLDDYEDEYVEEPDQARRAPRRSHDGYAERDDREFVEPAFSKASYAPSRRDEEDAEFDRYDSRPRVDTVPSRSSRPAMAPRPVDDGGPLAKITTLRPQSYAEARTIGERFRDGTPVIMDLVDMSNADAKRLVDFAAGLAFALRGSFDKVATKVFLLSPADIDVSAEERRRIAETGFYSQK
ncbi:cell division protein SepF [Rhodococcus sp. YH3-3]|uniref:cell division protein SepF n=1 Tax=Rhodococcus sp. YH3-3 TaxID=1803579 RepID=UPI0007DB400D|nr:cell division protein SepF [Rhodococcus sp. YH3-3]